jgi:integrase
MIYKRNETWHCDFTVNGQRCRQSLETKDKRQAVQLERDLQARAREGKLATGTTAEFSRLEFRAAAARYLSEVAIRRPERWERALVDRLRDFFAAKKLSQITADDIRAFQGHRLGQGKSAVTVNHETKCLFRILKRAKLLSRLRDDVQLLPVRKEPRSVLTEEEKQRLFATASSKPEWQVAYCAALLTANTSMRPVELRRLVWDDLDPFNRLVTVRRSKTDAGARIILNDLAWSAFAAMKQRADSAGTYAPEHYIFHRQFPAIDPKRPMSGWRSAWRTLRKAARMPGLRYYTLRHQCVTEMLESGVPESVVREVVGHIDPAMTRHYSHPRLAARRAAVQLLDGTTKNLERDGGGGPRPDAGPDFQPGIPPPPRRNAFQASYVTNHVTKRLPATGETS